MRMAILAVLACLWTDGVRAGENEIEFARRLIVAGQTQFRTDDLVRHLIGQIRREPPRKHEAALIEALLCASLARNASPEGRAELLAQAEKLCREALEAPGEGNVRAAAQGEYGGLLRDWLRALRRAAKSNPAAARGLSAEAARAQENIVAARRTEAERHFGVFDALFQQHVNGTASETAQPGFLARMTAAFNAWLAAEGRFVQAHSDWIECLEERDTQRTANCSAMLKRFERIEEQGAIDEFPVVSAWFRMQRGVYYEFLGETQKALGAWNAILDNRGVELPPAQRKALAALRRNVAFEIAQFYEKREEWPELIEHLERVQREGDLLLLLDEPRGFELRLNFARALVRQAGAEGSDFDLALRELRRTTEAERRRGARAAALYLIAQATADVLGAAQKRGLKLRADAEQWVQAGYGLFAGAEQKTLRLKELKEDDPRHAETKALAQAEYHAASRLYAQGLQALRNADTLTRLRLEVKARHELALCFYRQNLRYEAVIAAWSLLDAFPPDSVERELAKLAESQRRAAEKPLREAWAAAEPLIEKSYRLQEVTRAEARRSVHAEDLWNKAFAAGALGPKRSPWDAKLSREDPAYATGVAFFEQGRRFAAEVRAARQEQEQKAAGRAALAALQSADAEFDKVAAGSAFLLPALCQRAFARLQALDVQQLLKAPELPATAQRALEAIGAYEKAAAQDTSPLWTEERRVQADGVLILARAGIELGAQRYEPAREAANAYLAWVQKHSIENGAVAQALLVKFRALAALLEGSTADSSAALLSDAGKTMQEYERVADETRTRAWMLDTLIRVQQRRLGEAEDPRGVYGALAAWQAKKLELLAQDGSEAAQLAEHTRWLSFLEKSGAVKKTAEGAAELLRRIDPENRNARMDDSAWPALLARMAGGEGQRGAIDFADLNQRDRCRQEHRILIDLLYDTVGAALPENDPQRPAHDRLNVNLERAAAQIENIRKSFPAAQTLDARRGENGVALLQAVADEIDFRRRVLATRRLLLKSALELTRRADVAAGELDAYRGLAAEQLKVLMEVEGETPDLELQLASLYVQTRQVDAARALILKLRTSLRDDSAEYFDTLKLNAEFQAQQGRWNDAAEYPLFLLQTAGADSRLVRERWPEIGAFLEQCYAKGVKRPTPRN